MALSETGGETPHITLSMLVKNEEKRYLARMLAAAREYVSAAVIVDDGSTDGTVALCRKMLQGIPLKLVENKESKFHNEWEVRKQQWDETVATAPEWIIFLDADEIFEDKFKTQVIELAQDRECAAWLFRLYDFWDEEHYREDALWRAHTVYRPFMLRYQKDFSYMFYQVGQHCGRMPYNIFGLNNKISNLRLKHYGWARPEDRLEKYDRYMRLDPAGIFGSLAQYQSILDENVNLVKWEE